MIKAILMDFNGVIIDDEPIQHRAYAEILKSEGIEVSDEDYYSRLGMDDRTFVGSILEAAGKEADFEKVAEITRGKTEKWRAIVENDLPLFEGIEGFVRKMSLELSLGIVSMARREEIDFVLEKAGIADCFSVVVSADDVKNCKPDPECYRTGFRMLDDFRSANGHLPMVHADCLVIEDSPPGVMAARAAELPVLGVANTVDADQLRVAGAGSVTSKLSEWMPESVRRVFV
ncbi:MAG: HAD family hydrolase [Pyrinomonadaceae bacterium]